MKKILLSLLALVAGTGALLAQNKVTINPSEVLGEIRPLNGVGGGPHGAATHALYKAANIPFARLHDIGGTHEKCVELMHIFPDFDADENLAENYDFAMTDAYIKAFDGTGTKIIWRLGNNHHEPTAIKKYGAWPPKDFDKWARICEHVIRHYNEGWANGFRLGIEYWEIWNEPDGDQGILGPNENIPESEKSKVGKVKRYEVAPHSWGGTMEQYYEFAATAFKHLQKCFPDLKIGGPANAGFKWNEPFIQAMQKAGVKPGFYSWHRYSRNPETLEKEGLEVKALLKKYGWDDMPVILDEWNYVTAWDAASGKYSAMVRRSIKGWAYTAACLCHMQNTNCVDATTYYDWRNKGSYNGAFNKETGAETPAYYAIYDWGKLLEYGTQIAVKTSASDVYATAAKNAEGKVALMIARFNDDDSVYLGKTLTIELPEGCKSAICMLNDSYHVNSEYPVEVAGGAIKVPMEANSFAFIYFE